MLLLAINALSSPLFPVSIYVSFLSTFLVSFWFRVLLVPLVYLVLQEKEALG